MPCNDLIKANNTYFTYAVQIFDKGRHLLVLDEQVMTSRYIFHNMSFDFLVFQHSQSVVDQNWRRRGFEICPENQKRIRQKYRK